MKISEIRIDRTKNTGQFENLKLGFTVVVGEDESPVEAIERAKLLLDWEINKEDRDANRKRYSARLSEIQAVTLDGQADDKIEAERTKISNWLEVYEARQAEIEIFA